jgi:hypothetical protein
MGRFEIGSLIYNYYCAYRSLSMFNRQHPLYFTYFYSFLTLCYKLSIDTSIGLVYG